MVVAFSVAPVGLCHSVAPAVARAVEVVRDSVALDSFLPRPPHSNAAIVTTVERDGAAVMDVVRRAVDAVADVAPRVSLVLSANLRAGAEAEAEPGQSTSPLERLEAAWLDAATSTSGRMEP